MFDEMIADHDEIRRTVAGLRPILTEAGRPVGGAFPTLRWELTRRLLRHLAVEEQVFRRQGRVPSPTDTFEQTYRSHVADWPIDRIESEWPRYCLELRGILTTLDRRMEFEEREIYGRARDLMPVALN